MAISKDLQDRAQKTREDGAFTLKLDGGVSLAMLVSFAQACSPIAARTILAAGRLRRVSSCSPSAAAEQSLRIDGRNGTTGDRSPTMACPRWDQGQLTVTANILRVTSEEA